MIMSSLLTLKKILKHLPNTKSPPFQGSKWQIEISNINLSKQKYFYMWKLSTISLFKLTVFVKYGSRFSYLYKLGIQNLDLKC